MKRWILLLAILTAFPPLSTDMYLPALPLLQQNWRQPLVMINLTLIGFFASYCVFLLLYGPLSDRFGRRPPLMAGISVYILASLMCALSSSVETLIAFRVLQGAGGASASAISMAICKDVFDGRQRERVLGYVGVVIGLAPMLAPVLGGWLLGWLAWPWIFVAQALLGALALLGVYCMPETLPPVSRIPSLKVLGGYGRLVRNRRYVTITLAFSILVIPFFAFIAGSSNIYMVGFGLSERTFGYFFAFNAVALMCGSLVFTRLARRISSHRLLSLGFAGISIGGLWMLADLQSGPWRLCLPMAMISFCFGLTRPPSTNLVLEQADRDAGAASSLMIFTYFMIGSAAMGMISLNWSDKVATLGLLGAVAGGLTLIAWLFLQQRMLAPVHADVGRYDG